MAQPSDRPLLHVEGKNDLHALAALLVEHGMPHDVKQRPVEFPVIKAAGNDSSVVSLIEIEVRLQAGRPVGFIVDADDSPTQRWESIRSHLERVGVETPPDMDAAGFVGESRTYKTRVGVWMMPDNSRPGMIEDFLRSLIDAGDTLIVHADASTQTAKREHSARFIDVDQGKAVLACWLAWQEEPGKPYGTAVTAGFFQHDRPSAIAFVSWFRRLYGVPIIGATEAFLREDVEWGLHGRE